MIQQRFSTLETHFAQVLFGANEQSYEHILKNVFHRQLREYEITHELRYQDILFYCPFAGTFSDVY